MAFFGVDIGGSGIKGAPVNVNEGCLAAQRLRIATPQPATPQAVAKTVAQLLQTFNWNQPVGCTFPAVIKHGIAHSAANVDNSWINTNGEALLQEYCDCPVLLLNDADAAGIAEMRFGAGRGHKGTVIMLTLGTGIGSAIFINGHLLPNTEFGHMEIRGKEAECRASSLVRKRQKLSWKAWSKRLNEFLSRMESLFSPDLFIIGGGISRRHDQFIPRLEIKTPIVPAHLLNQAGIIGAAAAAAEHFAGREL